MKFTETVLDGVVIVEVESKRDERGFLARTYCEKEFTTNGLNSRWVQQNHTSTLIKGSVRGMHWQAAPAQEIKLVRCVLGRVLDVVVDVRPDSPTFGKWHGEELTADSFRGIYLPAGIAHGFQCLEERCDLFYLMSEFYQADLARGLHCEDPDVNIPWPLPVRNLSARDAGLPGLNQLV